MLLEQINQPGDLKSMTEQELENLAQEIREFIIQKLSATGGHLASNLGVVELTLALHYIYNSPQDKIIFDVGHQSYVHKILSGRQAQFDTLRQYQGLCGFVKRSESEHDVWEAGHSSTSLSAAMGMALARDAMKEDYKVIALIGDAAIASGMAFEALNHIGHEQKNLTVILNDNEMSIAPNVGALHNYLTKIRSDKHYLKAKEDLEHLLKKIPAIGGTLAKTAEKLKDSLKYMVVSGVLFEELGYTYFGPVDGHNLPVLLDVLKQADQVNGPVLVHVNTVKGKGYPPAEADSHKWHGAKPYKIESGKSLKAVSGPPNYTEVFGDALIELAEKDDRIIAITPAMPSGSGLVSFSERFPDRMIDVGIAEQHAATLSGALAISGMKPVLAIYSTFLQRAYDQVVHDICRQNLNVVFAIDRAGFVGADGETHQGLYDVAYLRHVPNMRIMMPKDENELRNMMKTALDWEDGPIAIRYPRIAGEGVPITREMSSIPMGKWEVLQEGSNLAILAVGPMVPLAMKAAVALNEEGHRVKVVNARFIKPVDEEMLMDLAAHHMDIITVEENAAAGGFGSAVMEFYSENNILGQRVKIMGVPDYFVEHGSQKDQRSEVGLTLQNVISEAKLLMMRERQRA